METFFWRLIYVCLFGQMWTDDLVDQHQTNQLKLGKALNRLFLVTLTLGLNKEFIVESQNHSNCLISNDTIHQIIVKEDILLY